MKKSLLVIPMVLLAAVSFAATETNRIAEQIDDYTKTNQTSAQVEADYTKAIEGRTADVLKVLSLTDTNQAAKVHEAVMAQYRALRSWHDDNDAKLKASAKDTNAVAQINASLKSLHDQFISSLAANLSPEQVDQVKDKMTYGVVQVTMNAYAKLYPDLTEAEKKQILAWLIEARETAMDQGSSNEKHAVFGKYKGRINNYLSKAGYDAKTGRKKVAPTETSTTSTNQPAK